MKYYFLGASLTPPELEHPLDIGFDQLMARFELNLTGEDKKCLEALRTYYDVCNLRLLWSDEQIDKRGMLAVDELEARVDMHDLLPEPVLEFLGEVDAENRLRKFSQLLSRYLVWESARHTGFLRDFFAFERDWRLILAGFRAKHMGMDLLKVMAHEDPTDPIVHTLLGQKDSPSFTMPYGFTDLEQPVAHGSDDPLEVYRAFAKFRFNRIAEMILCETFTVDWLLGYTILLTIAEEWNALEQRNGDELFNATVRIG
jgi:hypothetical protein